MTTLAALTGERFDLLEDALEVLTRLSTGDVISYDGRVVSLRNAQMRPGPVQRPHPPIWIGGNGPRRTLPLVARYADVWHAWGSPNSLREANARVDDLAAQAGRDPASICGPARCPSTTSTPPARSHPSGATPAALPRLWLARRRPPGNRSLRPGHDARVHRLTCPPFGTGLPATGAANLEERSRSQFGSQGGCTT